jgi:GNAT superfamily N-acetyltransferase
MKNITITGYYPGAIGDITRCHAAYYYENWGFDVSFEAQEGRELSEFMVRFRENADGLWVAKMNEKFAGSVAIDGNGSPEEGVRLRWFITQTLYQGTGIGKRLLDEAVSFCSNVKHERVFLWTFEGLGAAKALYERKGFTLAQERKIDQWGQTINEQMYELYLKK